MSANALVVSPSPLNVANGVTVLRILAVPALVVLMLQTPAGSAGVAAMFLALAASDALDGWLARSRGLVTPLGKLLDPLADKALIGGTMLALVWTSRLAGAVAAVILGREALVSALRWLALRRHGAVVAANGLGKVKMGFQVALVMWLAARGADGGVWLDVLVGATVAITIASALSYVPALRGAQVR